MIVGMITVFVVLFIIIQLSNLLIKIVNKIAPEEEKKIAKSPAAAGAIAPDVMEAIRMAVSKITDGKGVVTSVERLKG